MIHVGPDFTARFFTGALAGRCSRSKSAARAASGRTFFFRAGAGGGAGRRAGSGGATRALRGRRGGDAGSGPVLPKATAVLGLSRFSGSGATPIDAVRGKRCSGKGSSPRDVFSRIRRLPRDTVTRFGGGSRLVPSRSSSPRSSVSVAGRPSFGDGGSPSEHR